MTRCLHSSKMAFPHVCILFFSLQLFHTIPSVRSTHPAATVPLLQSSAGQPQSLATLLFLSSHLLSINHLYIPACYLLIYPCIPSNCSPFLPLFYSYILVLACKWLKNLSGISVVNFLVQKNVKIKLRAVFHHMLHPPLATTIFCMQEYTFGSAFLPSYTYISSTHTHLFAFLQSMVRFSKWVYITA